MNLQATRPIADVHRNHNTQQCNCPIVYLTAGRLKVDMALTATSNTDLKRTAYQRRLVMTAYAETEALGTAQECKWPVS